VAVCIATFRFMINSKRCRRRFFSSHSVRTSAVYTVRHSCNASLHNAADNFCFYFIFRKGS